MAYHERADRILLWGGRVEDSRVWAFDLETNAWMPFEQETHPTGIRAYQGMVFDPGSSLMFVFGGLSPAAPMSFEGTLLDETWTYDLEQNAWRLHTPEEKPTSRSHHAMARHSSEGIIIMFGGEVNSSYSGDMSDEVWTLDPRTVQWSLRSHR